MDSLVQDMITEIQKTPFQSNHQFLQNRFEENCEMISAWTWKNSVKRNSRKLKQVFRNSACNRPRCAHSGGESLIFFPCDNMFSSNEEANKKWIHLPFWQLGSRIFLSLLMQKHRWFKIFLALLGRSGLVLFHNLLGPNKFFYILKKYVFL